MVGREQTAPAFSSAEALTIGDYQVHLTGPHGATVKTLKSVLSAPSRPTPVYLRSHKVVPLIGREREVETMLRALIQGEAVQYYGESGIGKTTLLRHLAYFPPNKPFPDGIVYLAARRVPLPDLLQSLYDVFYITPPWVKPTTAEIRHALRTRRALLLLDDVDFEREDIEALLDVAPRSSWVISSHRATLEGVGRAVALRGLNLDATVCLIERELERSLTPEEHHAARELYHRLEGHPLRIVQAAARVREEGLPLDKFVLPDPETAPALTAWASGIAQLPDAQRQILALLAALGGAPLPAEHLASLLPFADASLIEALQQRGLAQSHSPRYSVTGVLEPLLPAMWPTEVSAWQATLLRHFAGWAEEAHSIEQTLSALEALRRCLQWGVEHAAWPEVLRLACAVESDLALGKQWGVWREVLLAAKQAAHALGDDPAEAWALHQLGTRAGCLGEPGARALLIQAVQQREALGETAAALASRSNFTAFFGAFPPPLPRSPKRLPLPRPVMWGLGLAVPLVVAGVLIFSGRAHRRIQSPPVTVSSSSTVAAASTLLVSPTPDVTSTPLTPTPSPTLSPTPTVTSTPTPTKRPTPTDTPTSTPTLTPSPTFTLTPTPTPAQRPVVYPRLVSPAHSSMQPTEVTFQWEGELYKDTRGQQSYQVTVHHVDSGQTLTSDLLDVAGWTVVLPGSLIGEWRWSVSVVANQQVLATSAEWWFWVDPGFSPEVVIPTRPPFTFTPQPPSVPPGFP